MEILNEVEEEEGDKEPELMSVRDIKKEGAKVFKKIQSQVSIILWSIHYVIHTIRCWGMKVCK